MRVENYKTHTYGNGMVWLCIAVLKRRISYRSYIRYFREKFTKSPVAATSDQASHG
jgi:hypothetical protein